MNNEYVDTVLANRKSMLKLTQQQDKEILKIYNGAMESLITKAAKAKDKSLTQRFFIDYSGAVNNQRIILNQKMSDNLTGAILKSSNLGINADVTLLNKAVAKAGLKNLSFSNMFSNVPNNVLEVLMKGDLYKDGKGLSSRIWSNSSQFKDDIDYIIKKAIIEKKSAYELAKDLEQFVKPSAKRSFEWRKVYPNVGNKQIDFNAMRLARTSINHSFREAQNESANRNPFVEAVHWQLSGAHYERQIKRFGEDICDEYSKQDKFGLGIGNFPKSEVPLSHPLCICTQFSVIPQSLDNVADELKAWTNGATNPKLDKWFKEYSK